MWCAKLGSSSLLQWSQRELVIISKMVSEVVHDLAADLSHNFLQKEMKKKTNTFLGSGRIDIVFTI